MEKPTDTEIWAQGWDRRLEDLLSNLPDPRGYYCREVFEKAVIQAETVRNKSVLSGSSFDAGTTVGRGALGAQVYYQYSEAQKNYVKPEDDKYVATVTAAIKKAKKCARTAGYELADDGGWVEKKRFKATTKGSGGRATVDMSQVSQFASPVAGGGGGKSLTFGHGGKFGGAKGPAIHTLSPGALSQVAQGASFQPVPGGQVPSEDTWETDLILQQAVPESEFSKYFPFILIAGVATFGVVVYLRRRNA
jgi:hypothetical protein